MQFTTAALIALTSVSSVFAQSVKVHVISVSDKSGSLAYEPNNITAEKGDMVQFQFMPKNHTVTQSNFDNPCEPISLHSNITGVFSGFMPVAADATSIPTYTIIVNATTPMWIYCSQGMHCQSGMSMVINENTKANATRSLANYQAMAKNVKMSLAPGEGPQDGTSGTTTPSNATSTGTGGGGYGSGSSPSGSAGSSPSSTTSSGTTKQTGAASAFKAPEAMGLAAVFAAGVALFL